MVLLNRLLSVLILLLAIGALVFSHKRLQRGRELRERGDTLAMFVSTSAKILDENSSNPIGAEVNADNNGKTGWLGWEAWHRDAAAYRGRLEKFRSRVRDVREMRDQLSQELVKIGAKFDNKAVKPKQLSDPAASGDQRAGLVKHLTAYSERDKFLVKSLRGFCELLDPQGFALDETALMAKENYVLGEEKVTEGIKSLQNLNRLCTDALSQVVAKLGGEARLGVSPTQIKLVKTTDVEKLLNRLDALTRAAQNDQGSGNQIKALNERLSKATEALDKATEENARSLIKIDQQSRVIEGQKVRINELEHRISGQPRK